MSKNKLLYVTAFALFSLFFGAGNLIFPPSLGLQTGDQWIWVSLGFIATAVLLPILGIMAHAKLQGTMFDFGKKVSPWFSSLYCIIVYIISISLPAPRTASVTHEMAIAPYFDISSIFTSSLYFFLVLLMVLYRSQILNIIGKYLTPMIVLILLSIIGIIVFSDHQIVATTVSNPLGKGFLEGYQTFDTMGAIVIGAVIIISLNFNKKLAYQEKKQLITKAGILAGIGLLLIYIGLIYSGASLTAILPQDTGRTELLQYLSTSTLGSKGTLFLSILVALACFTTAVGIITGTADYFKSVFPSNKYTYQITAIMACIIGVFMGQLDVHDIVHIALPALNFIYPISIVLIVLNLAPNHWASPRTFKLVVLITFISSVPDFMLHLSSANFFKQWQSILPFGTQQMGWILPAFLTFITVNLFEKSHLKTSKP